MCSSHPRADSLGALSVYLIPHDLAKEATSRLVSFVWQAAVPKL